MTGSPLDQPGRIVVVDDDPTVADVVGRYLIRDGHSVQSARDGYEALRLIEERPPDLVVLDLMLPGIDGLEVCRRLRASGDRSPVLMLTARDGIDDRVAGLDAGADDYLVKPFALRELMARVRALLRRRASADDDGSSPLRFDDLSLDPVAHEVHRNGARLELTRTEFALLELFMRHPRQVLSRSTIFEHVWGYDFGAASNTLGVYMGYLRRKTEEGGGSRVLHTVRGVGYILRSS